MKASEKYLIGCVTVMTVAYLWLIWQYSKQITAVIDDPDEGSHLWNAYNSAVGASDPVESGFVYDDPEDELPIPAPEGLNRPHVKGLEDE